MPYKDKEQQRAYMREWLQKRRQAWIETQGSVCARCGQVDVPFEVDHINPETKVNHRVWSWSQVRRDEELAKCQLLCEDCHWKKTGQENATGRNHGATLYGDGCRCDVCVTAASAIRQANRQRRKSLGLKVG